MNLEVLMSCMFNDGVNLVNNSNITCDAVVINQCDVNDYLEDHTDNRTVRVFSVTDRGLTKSRNLAISKSTADVCLLADDDELFVPNLEAGVTDAYESLPDADIIIFKMKGRESSFSDKVQELKFPKIMKVSSWQISFRRKSLLESGLRFDELMGSGTGNGAEEEFKFLTDARKLGLKIYYVPFEIAEVDQKYYVPSDEAELSDGKSQWFSGFDERFFENRGSTTRYIMGAPLAVVYAVYYCLKKRNLYNRDITTKMALISILRGIRKNRLGRLRKSKLE